MQYLTNDNELTRLARPVAGATGHGRQGQQGVQVPLHPLADGLRVSAECGVHPRASVGDARTARFT